MVLPFDWESLRDNRTISVVHSFGAGRRWWGALGVILPGAVIAMIIVLAKPLIFRWGFNLGGEKDYVSKELGIRLGQASEFSLLVAYTALASGLIDQRSSYLIQTVVILTFVISTYWVINKYPTPISSEASRRRD